MDETFLICFLIPARQRGRKSDDFRSPAAEGCAARCDFDHTSERSDRLGFLLRDLRDDVGVVRGRIHDCSFRVNNERCVVRVSLYTGEYRRHMIFVSHEFSHAREENCHI